MYKTPEKVIAKLKKLEFPPMKSFLEEDNLLGYIIIYNPTEKLFFSPKQESNIIKLYTFKEYKYNNYSTKNLNYVFIRNKRIFKSIG